MTSIDSGIEAECESNDGINMTSTNTRNNNMSLIPYSHSFSTSSFSNPIIFASASTLSSAPTISTSTAGCSTSLFSTQPMCSQHVMEMMKNIPFHVGTFVGYQDRPPEKIFPSTGIPLFNNGKFSEEKFPPPYIPNHSQHDQKTHSGHHHHHGVLCYPLTSKERESLKMKTKDFKNVMEHSLTSTTDRKRTRRFTSPFFNYSHFKENEMDVRAILKSFHSAAELNDSDKLLTIIKKGINPNMTDGFGKSALHKAALMGYTDSVKILLENGANPNLTDNFGQTALHMAALANHIDVVSLLLKHDCDVNSIDAFGLSPIQLAKLQITLITKEKKFNSDYMKLKISKVIDMLKLYLEKQKSKQNLIKPALLNINDEMLNNMKNSSGPSTSETDTVPTMNSTLAFTKEKDLDADIELLNMFQMQMKLSENIVENDLNQLLNGLNTLNIAKQNKTNDS